jgi:hypothetical protein
MHPPHVANHIVGILPSADPAGALALIMLLSKVPQ